MLEFKIAAGAAMTRDVLADHILARLQGASGDIARQWNSGRRVRSAIIDDLLPDAFVDAIALAFPPLDAMTAKGSMRERKYVAAQMDRYDPLLEEAVFAFQDPRIVALIAAITGLEAVEPDADLYAGGISAMAKGCYLRPHLDNSHDAKRERYRVLNLLFYVTPGWVEEDGGALQLWDDGPKGRRAPSPAVSTGWC
jgi:Rps23 Pro-64 3,4-dihydroxylase Tpa1-like proline 4-hydroxylase